MNPRIFIYLILTISLSVSGFAQQFTVKWANQFGGKGWDFANSMIKTQSGNFLIAGSLKGLLPDDTIHPELMYSNNALLALCDTNGNPQWQKTFGGGLFDNITSLSQTPSGILLTGTFQDSLFFDQLKISTIGYTGGYNALIDEQGNPVWLRSIGGMATINNILNSTSANGTTYIAGSFTDSLSINGTILSKKADRGLFLTRILSDGTEILPVAFIGTGVVNIGALTCTDSLLYVAGSFSDTLRILDTTLVSLGEEDIFVARFNHNGQLLNIKVAGSAGVEQVRSMAITKDGEIALTGFYDYAFLIDSLLVPTNGGRDIFITLIDSSFKALWIKNIGGRGNDYSYSLTSNRNSDFFLSGNFVHYMSLPDETGNLIEMDASSAFGNAFIAKLNKKGDIKASYNLPATSEDFCKDLIVDSIGKVTVVGNFYSQMNFQVGEAGFNDSLVSKGERDIFFLQFADLCDNIVFDAGSDLSFCNGQTLVLSPQIPNLYYRWLPDGLPNQDYEVNEPGSYKIMVRDMNGCIYTDSISVIENQLVSIVAGNDTTLNPGEVLHIENVVVTNAEQLEWNTDGTGYFDAPYTVNTTYSPSFEDISNGTVQLTVTAMNQCGEASVNILISIEQDDDGITVFPNPTSGVVTLVCTTGLIINMATIVTESGNIIQSGMQVNSTILQFDLSPYPPGAFLFHLSTPNGIVTKIVNKL